MGIITVSINDGIYMIHIMDNDVISLMVMKLHVEFTHSTHLQSMPHTLILFFYWYRMSAHYKYVDITNLPIIILDRTVCTDVIRG